MFTGRFAVGLGLLVVLIAVLISSMVLSPPAAAVVSSDTKEACEKMGGTWSSIAAPTNGVPNMGCTGVTPIMRLSLEEQVESYVFYRTLGTCLAGGGANLKNGGGFDGGERITRENAASGAWFGQAEAPGGVYLNGVDGVKAKVDNNGGVECTQTSLVNGALKLWNNWAPDEALCAMGMRSASDAEFEAKRCTSKENGTDELKRGDNMVAAFQKAVSDRMYGGKAPAITATSNQIQRDSGTYLLYLKTFTSICVPTAAKSTTPDGTRVSSDYTLRIPTRVGDKVEIVPTYYRSVNNKPRDKSVAVVAGPELSRTIGMQSTNCGALADAINGEVGKTNGLADAFGELLRSDEEMPDPSATNPGGGRDDGNGGAIDETQPTCGNTVAGIGWIICPALNGIATLNDGMWTFAEGLLTVSPLSRTDDEGRVTLAYEVWGVFRAFANVALIIVFMMMIFSQLTSSGISNYGVKKLLPRLVIAALMINLSFFAMQLTVDAANIAGAGIYDAMNSVIGSPTIPSWEAFVGTLATLGVAGGLAVGAIAIAPMAALMLALPLALGALLGFVVAVVTLMFRQAVIPLLAVLAPLAFVAYLLPNTKSWFDKWKGLFIAMLMLYPLAAILFAGMKMAGSIITSGGEWWMTLTALVVMGAPLFMLPYLARQSGPMLGKLQSSMRGLAGKFEKPVGNWAGDRQSTALAKAGTGKPGRLNFGRKMLQSADRGRRSRQLARDAYGAEADADFAGHTVGNSKLSGLTQQKLSANAAASAANAAHQSTFAANTVATGGANISGALGGGAASNPAAAAAISATVAKAMAEAIKEAELSATIAPGDVQEMGRKFREAVGRGDSIGAQAMQNKMLRSGGAGAEEFRSSMSQVEASARAENSELVNKLRNNVLENHGGVKASARDLSSWASDSGSRDLNAVSGDTETWKMSDSDLALQHKKSQERALASGAVSKDQAVRVTESDQLAGHLDPEVLIQFNRQAGK